MPALCTRSAPNVNNLLFRGAVLCAGTPRSCMGPPQARLLFTLGDPGLVPKRGTVPDNLRDTSIVPLPPSYTMDVLEGWRWRFLLFGTLPTRPALNQGSSLFLGSTCLFFVLFCSRFILLSSSFQFWDDQRVLFNLGLRRWL